MYLSLNLNIQEGERHAWDRMTEMNVMYMHQHVVNGLNQDM